MGDFDKLKNKIIEYQSPLDLEQEWSDFEIKRQPIEDRKSTFLKRNISILTIFILFAGAGIITFLVNNKSEVAVVNTYTEEQARFEETVANKTLPKQNASEEKKTVNITDWNSSSNNSEIFKPLRKVKDFEETASINKQTLEEKEYVQPLNSMVSQEENTPSEFLNGDIIKDKKHKTAVLEEYLEIESLPLSLLENEEKVVIEPLKIDTSTNTPNIQPLRNQFLMLELFGQGAYYSLNYGKVLKRTDKGETFIQGGFAWYPMKLYDYNTYLIPIVVPVSINQTFKLPQNESHHIIGGLGVTFIGDKIEGEPWQFYIQNYLKLGYKYQPKNSRFFYKIEGMYGLEFANIFYQSSNRFQMTDHGAWGSIGVGYSFSKKTK